ncbi:MAG: 30S ribosomal protein S20 [Candidatus Harrisonbacteria bacterium CG10_big_fil_rev_8_21_14_0_10_42_17]|uniref:Small ribosomal subunit protein bS20 n=1 Tax=Candidatus Harrisonbacteria bacterium CG10_big_fil_rev_8_21_14_0_10_42_17 TaxID=1974584 RepID=A0A2M6WIV9_9BACT|nr:MAG: 30S ribosomal protein S20 [Candidatus Harrisonbacteria bacterium CG10_big_fil_rev_8_21_14_0_10_42_17]
MPNIQSAKKYLRKSKKHHTENLAKNRTWKDARKDIIKTLADNKEEAAKKLSGVFKVIDKAAKTNAIKKNRAARLKSQIAKKFANTATKS